MPASDAVAADLVARVPDDFDAAVWRSGAATVVGIGAAEVVVADGTAALARLDALGSGQWVGWCAFELGHAIEAVRPSGASADTRAVPDVVLARFDAHAVVAPDGTVTVDGAGEAAAALRHAAGRLDTGPDPVDRRAACAPGQWRSSLDQPAFEDRVREILELLRAGECYQVNLTRRLTCDVPLDLVSLYGRIVRTHPAPHAGLLRLRVPGLGPVAVVTASPERYVRVDGRAVETRPIKGTASDPAVLRASAKDRAENVMIVDLARNDLGRVCEPGSIHVPELCAVEAHPGLHHLVSTVRGTRRADVGWGALVVATFPPASVTGAPKPRVLQAIEELEPVRRGVYCGAIGWIDTEHERADLAVAIRTFTVHGDRTELGVGGGIVADSSPTAEWEETELKAARLLEVAGAGALVPS